MTGWRIDLTVLTDLAASMFAACFMVMLIFLSLAQRSGTGAEQQVELTNDSRVVMREALGPDALVDMLRRHAASEGLSIDIFADRIELQTTGSAVAVTPDDLARLEGEARLYVFSNRLYASVTAALRGRAVTEIDVPAALRDTTGHWRADFLRLASARLDAEGFRLRLAALLNGSARGDEGTASSASGTSDSRMSLVSRLMAWVSTALAFGMPVLGLAIVLVIERRRRFAGQAHSASR